MSRIFRPDELDRIYEYVDDEEIQIELQELKELHQEVNESEGGQVLKLCRDIQRVDYLVNANYDDLSSAINRFESEKGLISTSRLSDLDEVLMHIARHLHNYIGSTVARYDHVDKRAISKIDDICDCSSNIEEEYEDRKAQELGDRPAFFTGLRNYSYHRRLPVPAGRESSTGVDDIGTRELYLEKSVLLESDWSPNAQDHLDRWGEEIDLKEELTEYHQSLNDLQQWIFEKIELWCDNEIDSHSQLVDEIEEKQSELIYR